MIRVAAIGDVHIGLADAGILRQRLDGVAEDADVLLLAGDLTWQGRLAEARVLVADLADLGLPVVAVLGNHDWHEGCQDAITELLRDAGISVLEGTATRLDIGDETLGVAGTKGFGGGFVGASIADFGEPLMRDFLAHSRELAAGLGDALGSVADCTARVALTHYSPVADTLLGEPREIYPFLGSHLLADAIDRAQPSLAVHGHAHSGCERGVTPGGVPVCNVALPVLRRPYARFELAAD